MFLNLEKKMKCGGRTISEYDENLPKDLSVEDILVHSSNIGSVKIGQIIGQQKLRQFLEKIGILGKINFDIEEIGRPLPIKWRDCKLKTVSYGHGITTTPLQATSLYAAMINGGNLITPSLIKERNKNEVKKIISNKTSKEINSILRKVVSSKNGTASLADKDGYYVGGKTGTAESYGNDKHKINSFVSVFPTNKPNYSLFVMLENPKLNKNLVYN